MQGENDMPAAAVVGERKSDANSLIAGVYEAMAEALLPFATTDWADENGWTDIACQNDRVVDWFGPSQFFAAGTAYLAYCNLSASRISQQDAELERMRREISESESERVRLWNENRDLRGSLDVEKAVTDSVKRELSGK